MGNNNDNEKKEEQGTIENQIAKVLVIIMRDADLQTLTVSTIVTELEARLKKQSLKEKKKFIRSMIAVHLDEQHPMHAHVKEGKPVREEEDENVKKNKNKESNDDEEEDDDDDDDDEVSSDEEEEEEFVSAKRTTRGDTNPTKKRSRASKDDGRGGAKKNDVKIKDPNKPKGAQGPYMCFVQHNRDKIMKEFPGIKFGEVGKKLGQRWQNLSEKGKVIYNEMAEKDKDRYNQEMKTYVPMSEAQMKKLREEKEDEKAKKSENSGFKKPYQCSEQLKTFLGGSEQISRAQLTSEMWKYFKENNLMDPENKQFVLSDDKLFALIGEKRFKAFGFAKHVSKHLIPME